MDSANKIQKIENFLADNYAKIIYYSNMPVIVFMVVLMVGLVLTLPINFQIFRLILLLGRLGIQIAMATLIIDLGILILILLVICVSGVYSLKVKKS